jgi:hypothetical protein
MIEKKVLRINKDVGLSQVEFSSYLIAIKRLVSKVYNTAPDYVQYP